jgi:methyl-accepting chemotaxis protein
MPELPTSNTWRRLCLVAVGTAGTGAGASVLAIEAGDMKAALALSLALAALVTLAVQRAFSDSQQRIRQIREALRAISQGNLSYRVRLEGMGDLRSEAMALNAIAESVGDSIQRMGEFTRSLQLLPEEISQAMAEIEQGSDNQEAAVEETASLLANINTSIRGINRQVEQLARHNEETASSITQMGSAVEQVAGSSAELQKSVEGSTSAVHLMSAQMSRVASSADSVQQVAEETASSISEMDRAIQEVGEHVSGANELTERVSCTAEEGTRAVGATIDGIARIRDLTLEARSALAGLDGRIAEIGDIATVIGGISDETNLLSLNAAIIAAQAGEHGKAFAVVAVPLKNLARRTTNSTKQIEELIQAVQAESANAVQAMGAGIEAVEEGVDRSRVAGEALEAIMVSSREASGRVTEIARAAEEQTRNSRHVAGAAQQTYEHIQQISHAMKEQSQAADQLLKNSTDAVELGRQVASATEEQRETGRYIATNAASITEMIGSIQRETASHAQTSSGVASTVNSILDNARKSCQRIPEVARAVSELQHQAEAASAEVARFDGSSCTRSDE